jgi:hypothetical protein
MYLPLPDVDTARNVAIEPTATRHVRYWNVDGDRDMDMYRRYCKALPARWAYLADRVLQCQILARDHGAAWAVRLDESVRAVIAVADPRTAWGDRLPA